MRTSLAGSTDHAQGPLQLLAIIQHEAHLGVHARLRHLLRVRLAIKVSQQLAIEAHVLRMLFLSSVLGELLVCKMVLSHGLER